MISTDIQFFEDALKATGNVDETLRAIEERKKLLDEFQVSDKNIQEVVTRLRGLAYLHINTPFGRFPMIVTELACKEIIELMNEINRKGFSVRAELGT